jgi:hypothetical protein
LRQINRANRDEARESKPTPDTTMRSIALRSMAFPWLVAMSAGAFASASWNIDATPPAIAFTVKPAITAANEAAYALAGTCSDDGIALTVQVGSLAATLTGPCGTPAPGQFATVPMDLTLLAQGMVNLQASMTDAAGNSTSITDATTKDSLGPALTIDALDAIDNASKATYGFTGGCETAGGRVAFALASGTTISGTAACTAGTYVASGLALSGLADGIVAFSVTQSDASGNATTTPGSVSKETVNPAVALDVLDTITVANQSSYNITGTCSEDGRNVGITATSGTAASFTVACTTGAFNAVGVSLAALADGTVAIVASLTDAAGNSATSSATATKDATIGAPTITAPCATLSRTPAIQRVTAAS